MDNRRCSCEGAFLRLSLNRFEKNPALPLPASIVLRSLLKAHCGSGKELVRNDACSSETSHNFNIQAEVSPQRQAQEQRENEKKRVESEKRKREENREKGEKEGG